MRELQRRNFGKATRPAPFSIGRRHCRSGACGPAGRRKGHQGRGLPASDGQPTCAYVSTNSFTGTNPIGITVYQVNAKDGSLAPVQAVADAFPS